MTKRGRPRKITDHQLTQIQALASSGKNYLEIARDLGLNKGSVRYFMLKYAQNSAVNNVSQ